MEEISGGFSNRFNDSLTSFLVLLSLFAILLHPLVMFVVMLLLRTIEDEDADDDGLKIRLI